MGVKGEWNGGKIRYKQSVPGLDAPDLATLMSHHKYALRLTDTKLKFARFKGSKMRAAKV